MPYLLTKGLEKGKNQQFSNKYLENPSKMKKFVLENSETHFQKAETRFQNAQTPLSRIFLARTYIPHQKSLASDATFLNGNKSPLKYFLSKNHILQQFSGTRT